MGRKPIDMPGYTFLIWVANRTNKPLLLWRATLEQHIEESKHDLAADDF